MRIVWRGFADIAGGGLAPPPSRALPRASFHYIILLPRSGGSACNILGWSALLVYGNIRMDIGWSLGRGPASDGRPVWSPRSWLDEMEGRPQKVKIVSVCRHLSKIVSYFEQNSITFCRILSKIVSANIRFYSYLCNEDEDKCSAAVRHPT